MLNANSQSEPRLWAENHSRKFRKHSLVGVGLLGSQASSRTRAYRGTPMCPCGQDGCFLAVSSPGLPGDTGGRCWERGHAGRRTLSVAARRGMMFGGLRALPLGKAWRGSGSGSVYQPLIGVVLGAAGGGGVGISEMIH
jgi:hypothetical protein